MSKMNEYINKVNVIIQKADWSRIEQKRYQESIAKKLVAAFSEVYGTQAINRGSCVEDNGLALVPAQIKTADNKTYLGLLDICMKDSGEHYGTRIFFKKYGVINQDDFRQVLPDQEIKKLFPCKYRPLITI